MSDIDPNLVASNWQRPLQPPPAMPEQVDVVVIGGGIVGVSTAWFLAKQGVSVALCEKASIACEQSGRNWGWVRIQGRDEREIPMMLESLRIWSGLAEDIGEDVGFRRGGCSFVARTSSELAALESWQALAGDYGLDTQMIDKSGLDNIVQAAGADWLGALYTQSDGRAEPHLAAPALARAAARAGARVLTGCAVRGLELAAGRVSAVITEHGRIKASTVLCAGGAWTSMFCRSLGVDVPQLRVKGSVGRTAPGPDVLDGNLFDERVGIRRRQDGGYTVASGSILEHPVTPASFRYFRKFFNALRHEYKIVHLDFGRAFVDEWRTPKTWALESPSPFETCRVLNPSPSPRVMRKLRNDVDSLFPQLRDVPIVESWAGMIEASPDIVPVIDAVDALPGFYVATGFSGHGFGIGPGAGKAIAAMLTDTESGIDLQAFKLSRFFDGSPIRPTAGI